MVLPNRDLIFSFVLPHFQQLQVVHKVIEVVLEVPKVGFIELMMVEDQALSLVADVVSHIFPGRLRQKALM